MTDFYMMPLKEQPAREEGLVRWVHGHGDDSLVVASKVPDVLVLSQGHVPGYSRYRQCPWSPLLLSDPN